MKTLKQGQILTRNSERTRKVLGICGEAVFVSDFSQNRVDGCWTEEELRDLGYTWDDAEEQTIKTPIIRYGVMSEDKGSIVCAYYTTMDSAKRGTDEEYPYIVELTVTKVFVRAEDYKEVEI